MKLVEVMASVDRVAKNGNNAAQGYKYAQASDIYDATRGELAQRFVLLVPRPDSIEFIDKPTKAGGTLNVCMWKGAFDFTDAETGEVLTVKAFGQGSDSGDKALYKAVTGATKSIIVQMFLIPTGDDPENEPKQSKAPPPAGAEALKARMKASAPSAPPATNGAPAAHDRTLVYPFGNSKGQPISAVDDKSLVFWLSRCTEELADATKSKWHDKARERIATLQAEQAYRRYAAQPATTATWASDEPPPLTDDDAPH